jgi:hypothetical protein
MTARTAMVPHDRSAGLTIGFTSCLTICLTTGNDRTVPPGDRLES